MPLKWCCQHENYLEAFTKADEKLAHKKQNWCSPMPVSITRHKSRLRNHGVI